jgi:flagellar protein FliO/FliZ
MEGLEFIRAMAALILVLGLLLALAWIMRRFAGPTAARGPLADVSIVGWKPLDQRRKLAVIRWGQAEHLVILGPQGETLLETRAVKHFNPELPAEPALENGAQPLAEGPAP